MRRLYLVVLPLCLLIGTPGLLQSQEKRPNRPVTEIRGRSLESWIKEIPSKDQSKSEIAIQSVMLFGPERAYQAVPVIIDRLKKHSSSAPVDTAVRVHGMIALGLILGEYKEAGNKDMKDAVTLLKNSLKDKESVVKYRAVEALGRIGPAARDALPEVIGATDDLNTFETRQAAATALGQIALDKNGPSGNVLNALYDRLRKDSSSQVRLASIRALTTLGGSLDSKMRPGLVKALDLAVYKDLEPSVRIWADMAVMSVLKTVDQGRVDRVAGELKNTDAATRAEAAQVLGTIGADAKRALPPLMKGPNDTDGTEVRGRPLEYWIKEIPSKDQSKSEIAIQSVMLFGAERAYQAVPMIIDRLKKHSPSAPVDTAVRVHGMIALGLILGENKQASTKDTHAAVTLLKNSLKDKESVVKYRAAEALGRIGPAARDALPEVIGATDDPYTFETRQAAATALGQIALDKNGPSVNVLTALYDRLRKDYSSQVRLASIRALTTLGGPLDPKMRLGLVKALDLVVHKDSEPSVRIWADMAVMSVLKTVDKDRVDRIAGELKNTEATTRAEAAQALGTIGPDAKRAIPLLMKALSDTDGTVVAWVVYALGKMGPAARDALSMLERIKADPSQLEAQRKAAGDA
ncbi:MAG TPA: HEAT repeat domain-containing protein, partial [Gemmataceae bacterium]|nr:HEAT repeat domain-containing protein [Gemmataceae bacterium]